MTRPQWTVGLAAALMMLTATQGCKQCIPCPEVDPPAPLGATIDPIWQLQEANGEASNDFVIRENEFTGNTPRLNARGEQHVKQIAVRVNETPFPVIIEPSSMDTREGDHYGFAVHNDPELDLRRREVIVHIMEELGVKDADQRVVIAPDLTEGYTPMESMRSYAGFIYGGGIGGGGGGGFGGGSGFGGGGGGGGF